MSNDKGFTLIEVLIALSIILLLATTFVPISTLIQQHTAVLSDRRIISSKLHDELQIVLWEESSAHSKTFIRNIRNKKVVFQFSQEEDLIKGCVEWDDIKNDKETFCLYGYP